MQRLVSPWYSFDVKRVRRDIGAFRGLTGIERVTGGIAAAFVAFSTFIFGLTLLFDHVHATKGHSATAWSVSLVGLVISVLLGLCAGGSVITTYGRSSTVRRTPLPQSLFLMIVIAAAILLAITLIVGGLDALLSYHL